MPFISESAHAATFQSLALGSESCLSCMSGSGCCLQRKALIINTSLFCCIGDWCGLASWHGLLARLNIGIISSLYKPHWAAEFFFKLVL